MSLKGNIKPEFEVKGKVSLPEVIEGKSAYGVAVKNGFEGTEEEWLESLVGLKGDDYELTDEDKAEIAGVSLDRFHDGAEYVFDGGDALSEIDIEIVVDKQMSDNSDNAVANRVVKAYIDGKIIEQADYFVEVGKSGIWDYEKRASGIVKCWGIHHIDYIICDIYHEDGYYQSNDIHISFPFDFPAVPHCMINGCNSSRLVFPQVISHGSSDMVIRLMANSPNIEVYIDISIEIKGRWK